MPLSGNNTYVGFGLGAIQSGLFLYEAYQSGNFKRLIVVEVIPEIVSNIRNHGGRLSLNIAYEDRLEKTTIEGIDIRNPNDPSDRDFLIRAIAESQEIGTAVPSVDFYCNDKPGSIDRLLAEGLILKNNRGYPHAVHLL